MHLSDHIAHTSSCTDLAQQFQADLQAGLSNESAKRRLETDGPNRIEEGKQVSLLVVFLRQFLNVMVYLLAFASVVSFVFEEWLDGTAILVVILVNAAIGFFMEWQARRSMDALKRMVTVPAKVIRGGILSEISSEEVVPGDLLFVEAGDMISADARIADYKQLLVDESALTGESLPVEKQSEPLGSDVPLAERSNMLYRGTFVTRGNAHALVVKTGMQSELGQIASLVGGADQQSTPLEKKLEEFSKKLIWITVSLVVIIFIVGVINKHPVVIMLETAIALAVAAIPEGLPIVSTLALASGMMKLARHNVIVKKLAAVETLGGTNVICTDKTGTLTQNRIEVNALLLTDQEFTAGEKGAFVLPASNDADGSVALIQRVAVLCNTASYLEKNGKVEEVGDPLETGLLKFAFHQGVNIQEVREKFPKVHEIAFTSETKVMATLHRSERGYWAAAKGASEQLMACCSHFYKVGGHGVMDAAMRSEWLHKSEKMASDGLRVLAFAFRKMDQDEKEFMHDLVFIGLIGFLDPVREEVHGAIDDCHSAGIRVVMITGDHPFTALNIAQKLGISEKNEKAVNGTDMKDYAHISASDRQLWMRSNVFARVSPKQKLDLVTALQDNNNIVGMTGDGVNDAPALKKADIGIAMGLRGTQVAQEVADMVLKDDSFNSIVRAIRQGRIIFENIQKFVLFLLSCNLSELFVVAVAAVFNLHFQLVPLQILFINIVTDVLPALALGVGRGNDSVMRHPPRNSKEPLMSESQWRAILIYPVVMTFFVMGAVWVSHHTVVNVENLDKELCNNILFFTLIFTQLFHIFNMTTGWISPFRSEVVGNYYVWYAFGACVALTWAAYAFYPFNEALRVHPMGWSSWLLVIGASVGSLLTIQLMKRLRWVQ